MSVAQEQRFWSNVDQGAADECWEWLGSKGSHGYGQIRFDGRGQLAHRVSVQLDGREILDGQQVCHHCDHKPCVNPAHLFLGSQADNIHDAMGKGRHRKPPLSTRKGAAHPLAKLTEADVVAIRAAGGPRGALAASFGVSRQTVDSIKARRTWSHV